MPVKKNVVSPLNSFKCSASRSKLAQNAYLEHIFCKNCPGGTPRTPILCMLIVFHTMQFAETSSKSLVHYYYMPKASKILSTGIASIPLYKFTIRALISNDLTD